MNIFVARVKYSITTKKHQKFNINILFYII